MTKRGWSFPKAAEVRRYFLNDQVASRPGGRGLKHPARNEGGTGQ
jgi:hypothetical protein